MSRKVIIVYLKKRISGSYLSGSLFFGATPEIHDEKHIHHLPDKEAYRFLRTIKEVYGSNLVQKHKRFLKISQEKTPVSSTAGVLFQSGHFFGQCYLSAC